MCTIKGISESTYASSYTGELPTLPLIKYKTLPCLYPPGSTVPCRQVQHDNLQRQNAIKRVKRTVPQPPQIPAPAKPRPGSGKYKCGPSRPVKVFDTKFGPMDMVMIDELYKKTRYTTLAQKAGAELALPVQKVDPPKTTQEPKADMVRLYGQRYEQRPEEWQDAVFWDRIQARAPTTPRPITPGRDKLLRRRQITNVLDQAREDTIRQLVRSDGLANVFARKCPGYAGYNPLCPPDTRLDDKKEVNTLMSASYRELPHQDNRQRSYARRGIFTKSVTLTYPFNPFNKVGQEIITVDKESRYSSMRQHVGLCNDNID
ncbi:hypothetical protein ACF0H5_006936 [Mactra antiquata]